MDLSFWTKASPMRRRMYTVIFIFLLALILTIIGALIPVDHSTAQQISNQLNQTVQQNKSNGTLPEYIFLNNFPICLAMFIPIVGPIFGFIVLFDTGYAISALAQVQGVPSLLLVFAELLTPVFWIEFAAYSIAIAESIWLTRRIFRFRAYLIKEELRNTLILIGVCAGLLAIGAIVEAWLISIGV